MMQALPNIQSLANTITTDNIEIALGSRIGTDNDIVHSLSLEVRKKKMINELLMAVLLAVRFVGGHCRCLCGTVLNSTFIGDAGAGATTVYAIVEHSKSWCRWHSFCWVALGVPYDNRGKTWNE
ncbi:hypothetical protein BO83DRAFT_169771 [Aspergillus eucalypticola CBS 122712]|uniref:Uncharacterized protein n=1 Tax=Aspergillus eucalypticola (strain CBS 122712 / IBT 29274) TaxID=1448314 RepID=A0A317W4X5_ASPEC|nr:uncharacterized protein BO83DRAFT_169771 [Aspergillus eucalypticola CBS 122712]PWY81089.1 hypothetical protein BO83DRAFT_169771 [Aspergillus eucalypticola CBS 122712]